jgi:hypothetical protein
MGDTPEFDHPDPDHVFQVNDVVYVIDPEGFDIYEATIRSVDDETYDVWYPDYEQDEQIDREDNRLLERTPQNQRIYAKQEKIRLAKERGEQGEDSDESDEDDYEQKEKVKRSRKTKPMKEPKPKKPAKAKAPKPPKPVKPAKEQKRKLTQKQKESITKEESRKVFHRARGSGISGEFFPQWLDENFPEVDRKDKETWIRRYQKEEERRRQKVTRESSSSESRDFESGSDDGENTESPEPPKFEEPEPVVLPPAEGIREGIGLRWTPDTLSIEPDDREEAFAVLFDTHGHANCFVYKTSEKEWLILNGMRFEMATRTDPDDDALYAELRVGRRTANVQTSAVVYPKVKLRSWQRFVVPAECHEYLRWKRDEKKREKGTAQLSERPEVPARPPGPVKKGKGRKSQDIDVSGMEDNDTDG